MLRYLISTMLLWSALTVAAGDSKRIEYEASYLGIPLLDMTLTWTELDSTVLISYDNQLKSLIGYFHPIHNIYTVRFLRKKYDPLSWSKKISEGSMKFLLSAERSQDGATVKYSNGVKREFPEEGFTVFSATHFLAAKAHDPAFFPNTLNVLIDGEYWKAEVSRYTPASPHPDHTLPQNQTLIQADLHYISGKRVMDENDILMSVIATEGTRFLLWVLPDGTYTKAQFGEFPRAVVLIRL